MLTYEMYTVYGMKFSLPLYGIYGIYSLCRVEREMGTYDLTRSVLGGIGGPQDHRYSMDVEG